MPDPGAIEDLHRSDVKTSGDGGTRDPDGEVGISIPVEVVWLGRPAVDRRGLERSDRRGGQGGGRRRTPWSRCAPVMVAVTAMQVPRGAASRATAAGRRRSRSRGVPRLPGRSLAAHPSEPASSATPESERIALTASTLARRRPGMRRCRTPPRDTGVHRPATLARHAGWIGPTAAVPAIGPSATLPPSRRGPRGVGRDGPQASAGRCEPRGYAGPNVAREPCAWRPIQRRERARNQPPAMSGCGPGRGTSRWYHDPVRPLDERVVSFPGARR